jgi:ABC-type Zn uptake system ZnuABC Zn-binding protein ZnuA
VSVKSLQPRSLAEKNEWVKDLSASDIIDANLIILDGFNSDLVTFINENKSQSASILTLNVISKSIFKKQLPNFYWMNPLNWLDISSILTKYLKRQIPELRSEITYRSSQYNQDINSKYRAAMSKINTISNKKLYVAGNHNAVKQFVLGFNLNYIDLSLQSSGVLDIVVEQLSDNKIDTIFTMFNDNTGNLDQTVKDLQQEGVAINKVISLYGLGLDFKGNDLGSYDNIFEFNSSAIIDVIEN